MTQYIILLTSYTWYLCYFVELLDCLFLSFHNVSLFCYCEGNSGYINSNYDVRCRVYIWGFSYLDYSFDVLISWISNLGLYNWFPYSYFTYCLISCSYVFIFTIHLSCTRVPDMHATWLYHMYSPGCIWQPWILMSRSRSMDYVDLTVADQRVQ